VTGVLRIASTSAVAAVAAVVLAACGGDDQGAEDPAERDSSDESIAQFLESTLPATADGALVAARRDEMVHCDGFGFADRDAETPAGCDTVFDVMSMTKQFTGAAVLKLEMMGRLRVTDPIAKFLGPVPADKREITVHQLLTHTSGLPDALGDDYQPLGRDEMVASALASSLESRPGTTYLYSNVGYSLLAAIIEDASGVGYEEFLAEQLFRPAGMTQTGYVLPNWEPDRVAVEYDDRGRAQGTPLDHPWDEDGPYWNLRGNGGMLSTARDMFRWHVALQGEEVLNERAKAELFEPYVREGPGATSFYGYGWVIVEPERLGRVAWHNGGNGWSFGVVTRLLDDRLMVFWITNRFRDAAEDWNLARLEPALTRGVVRRLRDDV
jgi:CubicO group peptidase (beta-lactamase class C family)